MVDDDARTDLNRSEALQCNREGLRKRSFNQNQMVDNVDCFTKFELMGPTLCLLS